MKTQKEIRIPIDIYKAAVFVWICPADEAWKRYQEKGYFEKGETRAMFDYSRGKAIFQQGVNAIVWVESKGTRRDIIGGLTHEFLHIVFEMMLARGSYVHDSRNAEHYTYLLEYLMSETMKQYKI